MFALLLSFKNKTKEETGADKMTIMRTDGLALTYGNTVILAQGTVIWVQRKSKVAHQRCEVSS